MRILLLFLLTLTHQVFAGDIISVPSNQYNIDQTKKIIVTNFDVNVVNSTWTNVKSSILLDVAYDFDVPVNTIQIGHAYMITDPQSNKRFSIYFTQLPLISISTQYTIVDDPNVLAQFKLVEMNQQEFSSIIGVQHRGAYSQNLPKKSMEIEFWKDVTGEETVDVSLLGLHTADSYNLQAMYNEQLRVNSKISNDLWQMMHTVHYASIEPDAVNGITMKYAELFLNGRYWGIYCIGEKVNRKLLKLKKYNGSIRGELYKGIGWGNSNFTTIPAYSNSSEVWSGLEIKYPNEIIEWANIHSFVNFVIHSKDTAFYANYKTKFNIDNAVDYFIFLNLLRAMDNTGKNIYIAKYNSDDAYFYVPWDLDGTFGFKWNGEREIATEGLLTNGLYERLWKDYSEDGFRDKLHSRWEELRTNTITHDAIMSMFNENYTFLLENGAYEREHIAWPDYNVIANNITYVSRWLTNRLIYLDDAFDDTELTTSLQEAEQMEKLVVYPNPASDFITIQLSMEATLTIYNSMGQILMTKKMMPADNIVSVSHLESGIYYLKLIAFEKEGAGTLTIIK